MDNPPLHRNRQTGKVWLPGPAKPLAGSLRDKFRFRSNHVHHAQNCPAQDGLIMPSQQGNQFMANAVALNVQKAVGGVFGKWQIVGLDKRTQRLLGKIEQRAGQADFRRAGGWVAPFHPGQSFTTGAAQKPDEEQFDLIIGVMGQSDHRALQF